MFHIFICKLTLTEDMTPTYINITDNNEEAMQHIRLLFNKFTDVEPLRLYKCKENLLDFKEKFYKEFQEFEYEELKQGRVYVEGVLQIVEMFLQYHYKDFEIVETN
jgi:hypothetical protein